MVWGGRREEGSGWGAHVSCDGFILIFGYNKEARTEDNTSISELIIGKHRNGPTATIELLFKKNTSTFLNLRKEPKNTEG